MSAEIVVILFVQIEKKVNSQEVLLFVKIIVIHNKNAVMGRKHVSEAENDIPYFKEVIWVDSVLSKGNRLLSCSCLIYIFA